jgi:hypothetical protein
MLSDVRISDNFWASEVLPSEAFSLDPISFNQMITPFLRIVPEQIRSIVGRPIIINNWKTGGQYRESGYRNPKTSTGAGKSYHKIGYAIDVKVPGMSTQEIYAYLYAQRERVPMITTYERLSDTPNWNHFDCRFTGLSDWMEVPGK